MQHVAKQHGVETLIAHGKMPAVVREILDVRGGTLADVEPYDRFADQRAEMVRDKTITATNVEHVGPRRQHTRHLQRHVVRAADFAPSSHAPEAALDRGE